MNITLGNSITRHSSGAAEASGQVAGRTIIVMVHEQYLKQQEQVARCFRWGGVLVAGVALAVLCPAVIWRVFFLVWAVAAVIPILWLMSCVLVASVRAALAHFRGEGPRKTWDLPNTSWRYDSAASDQHEHSTLRL